MTPRSRWPTSPTRSRASRTHLGIDRMRPARPLDGRRGRDALRGRRIPTTSSASSTATASRRPSWQQRHGAVARLLAGALPDVAPVADMVAAVALDLPDLLAGHVLATIRSMLPDLRHNVRTLRAQHAGRVDADAASTSPTTCAACAPTACRCSPSGAASTGSSPRRRRPSSPRSRAWTCTGCPAGTPGCSRGPAVRPTCSRQMWWGRAFLEAVADARAAPASTAYVT